MREAALILASDQGSLSRGGGLRKKQEIRSTSRSKEVLNEGSAPACLFRCFSPSSSHSSYVNKDRPQSVAFPRKEERATQSGGRAKIHFYDFSRIPFCYLLILYHNKQAPINTFFRVLEKVFFGRFYAVCFNEKYGFFLLSANRAQTALLTEDPP
jgi:hypothetical protein